MRQVKKRVAFYGSALMEYSDRVVDGILRYLSDNPHYTIRDFRYSFLDETERRAVMSAPPPWVPWRADGVITMIADDPGLPEWAMSGGIPIVNASSSCGDALPSVCVSSPAVARLAFEHFKSIGAAHLGFVGVRNVGGLDRRRQCYVDHLAAQGETAWTFELESNPTSGLDYLEERAASEPGLTEFLRRVPKPIGILAGNDQVGRSVCLGCRRLELAVPGEVMVLGVGNLSSAITCDPPLSSIPAPGEQVGYEAMTSLVRAMRDRSTGAARTEISPDRVVMRQSTSAMTPATTTEFDSALRMIQERACEGLQVDAITSEFQVSRSTLERQFATALGRTPAQEIARVRIERAKELLRTTGLSVTAVSQRIGYLRHSTFDRAFRAQTGLSPRDYRKNPGG